MEDGVPRSDRSPAALLAIALALIAALGLTVGTRPSRALAPLHATVGPAAGIFDAAGRQVLLRGVAVNELGDYYRVLPHPAPTFRLRPRDFSGIHRLGFDAVRLVISWSRLEPKRGKVSARYLRRIHAAVRWARRRDLYVILDLHQDAWGKEVATPPGVSCPSGYAPSIGWDGAPRWATYFDRRSRCHNAFRELSPAVAAAFDNLYANRDGIEAELAHAWGRLAGEFAANPAVAGYDLFNEPHPGTAQPPRAAGEIGALYRRLIASIRAAEGRARDGFRHIVFFEPSVFYDVSPSQGFAPRPDFTSDRDIVFSPHLYPGTFSSQTPAEAFAAATDSAAAYRSTFWVGEWGWYGAPASDRTSIAEFAAEEDSVLVGGAWWQWRQRCTDPHQFGYPGAPQAPIAPGLVRYRCPGDRPIGIPSTTRRILSRAYPRAAPGRLESIESDPVARTFAVRGDDPGDRGSCALVVWTPRQAGRPRFRGHRVGEVSTRRVPGGWRTRACARGSYELRLAPG